MPTYGNIQEEELKNKVAHDYFAAYDSTQIIGKIDFCIAMPQDGAKIFETESLLWAEAKAGNKKDIYESFVQLILTIGKERTLDKYAAPDYLGAFDAEKIAFLPFETVGPIFNQNDFNWNVAPSNHATKEFHQLYNAAKKTIEEDLLLFHYVDDDKDLRAFIRSNFKANHKRTVKRRITLSNITHIYQHWCRSVKPSINIVWETAKVGGILDADFFLADILSKDNLTLKEKLFVLLKDDRYILDRKINDAGLEERQIAHFMDDGAAHSQFWNRYARPPQKKYWDTIVKRRDLLVPQDVRERKGSYFTPTQWVELSQEYLEAELGENWQNEYTIWDCAAGTGNLLAGLTNKYNIWASTLDQADVDVMHDRIANGANLLDSHVFQFDFLNDPFNKLPQPLQDIINDEEKRKKLVIYINPPYAEAGSSVKKKSKTGVSNQTFTHKTYSDGLGKYAKRELFVQFIIRVYREIPGTVLAEFSTLKILQAPYFGDFRKIFQAKLGRSFIVPANTFDNVRGEFPIGFFIWHTNQKELFVSTQTNVYQSAEEYLGHKTLMSYDNSKMLNDWLRPTWKMAKNILGYLVCNGNDFQHQKEIIILSKKSNETSTFFKPITMENLMESCIYFSVRKCIPATWLNDRDQFLYPNEGYLNDDEFQLDCLAYALFSNNVRSEGEVNYWIPFIEQEVDAKEKFKSHFMSTYVQKKLQNKLPTQANIWEQVETAPLSFSPEAQSVFDSGRALWRYYHAQPDADPNAALYDIRLYFQGVNEKGKMNADSDDEHYMMLITTLRQNLKLLAKKIEPKVYEYGFLLK